MTSAILKDKLLGPLYITFIIFAIQIRDVNDWWFIFTLFLIIFIVLITISVLKTDLYIHSYNDDNGIFEFKYQRNFYKTKVITFSIKSESIESFKFNSSLNSLNNSFHGIYIKYIDEDGDIDDKSFKINDNDAFINILSDLKNSKIS